MSQSGDNNSSGAAEECYNMEFRSYADDAWYSVRVFLEGEKGDRLRVKYYNFPDDQDSVFLAESFKTKDEIYEFKGRFRKVSAQLQDADCFKVVKGMRVCASGSFSHDDNRFYDAIVEDVLPKKHSTVNGQEECECTFLLYWIHGPDVKNLTDKGVADICLLQASELEPKLASFMEIAKQKITKALCVSSNDLISVSVTSNDLACNLVAQHKENNDRPIVKQKQSFVGSSRHEKSARRSLSKVWPSEGVTEVHCENTQDTDVGGDKNPYIILVQNLEKQLSSSTVSEFIHKQTSIATQVYIFPSLPWEPYTNGVIMLDSKKDIEQLFSFLQNPNHFIVSSKGR
ncbi:hypothetical protein REPUB_Repub12eG0067700 [Reevesia pubescens]